ncbi:hypothetical protein BDW66DRAFT_87522 [Aspergillus desertorum]
MDGKFSRRSTNSDQANQALPMLHTVLLLFDLLLLTVRSAVSECTLYCMYSGVTDNGNPGLLSFTHGSAASLFSPPPLSWCLFAFLASFYLLLQPGARRLVVEIEGRTVPLRTARPSMRGGGARTDSNEDSYLQLRTSFEVYLASTAY